MEPTVVRAIPAGSVRFEVACNGYERFMDGFNRAAQAVAKFGRSLFVVATTEYLATHKRLPGSDRTARLRKKRRSVVLAWYANQLDK